MRAVIVVTLALCLTVTALTIYPQPISAQPLGQPAIPLDDVDRLLQEGRRSVRQDDDAAAIVAYEKALVILRGQRDRARNREGDILTRLGQLAKDKDQYDKATRYYQQALDIAQAIGNQQEIFQALVQLGTLSRDRDSPNYNSQQSLTLFQKALDLSLQLRDASQVQRTTRKLISLQRNVQGTESQQRDRILALRIQLLNAAKQFGTSTRRRE
jgi:tetratricopeptide (TPR) repeat protein